MTTKIPLTHHTKTGIYALIDDADGPEIMKHQWCLVMTTHHSYAARSEWDGKISRSIFMHRQLMKAKKKTLVDHKDRNGLNNQRDNLRFCTVSQNAQNKKGRCDSASGVKGVLKSMRKPGWWRAYIRVNGKDIYLGTRPTIAEMKAIYDAAAKKHFGDFACE